ncbi:MAG: hypothetical protein ACOZNI_32365 [Myxococcota bacterium]
MLAFVAAVQAAPLSPAVVPGAGPDVALSLTWSRELLVARGCESCDAWREATGQALHATWQIVPVFGLYGSAAHVTETIAAARYEEQGFGFALGVRGDLPVGRANAVEVWGEYGGTFTGVVEVGGTGDGAGRMGPELGAAFRAGDAEGGVYAWLGAAVTPPVPSPPTAWAGDAALVLDGTLRVELLPVVPIEGIAGVGYASEPLAGPWNERGRLTGGLRGTAGWRNSVTGWLGATF